MKTNDEIGASVEPLRKQAPQAVQAAVPDGWREQFAAAVYEDLAAADNQDVPLEEYPARILKVMDSIVGPRHPTVVKWRNDAIRNCIAIARKYCRDPESHKYLKQDIEVMLTTAPAHPAEGVPAQDWQDAVAEAAQARASGYEGDDRKDIKTDVFNAFTKGADWERRRAAIAATQPAAQGMDAIRELIAQHSNELERNHYAYFELAYTRRTGWMVWITDKPAFRESVLVNPDRKVLARGQGDTPEAACADALAAQAKQGEQQCTSARES